MIQKMPRRKSRTGRNVPLTEPFPSARSRLTYEGIHLFRLKYEHAARYPWLPVEPDPPRLK